MSWTFFAVSYSNTALAKILNPDTASTVGIQEISGTTEGDDDVESLEHGLENQNISENIILQYDKELDEEVEKLTFGQCGGKPMVYAGNDIVEGEEDFEVNDDESRSQNFARCRTIRNFQLIESAHEQVSKRPFNCYVRGFCRLF